MNKSLKPWHYIQNHNIKTLLEHIDIGELQSGLLTQVPFIKKEN